jgi:hypothetical protein
MARNPKDTALRALVKAHAAVESTADARTMAVRVARRVPVTWREIAVALGVAERNAIRKYNPLCDDDAPDAADVAAAAVGLTAETAAAGVLAAQQAHERAVDAEFRAVHAARDVAVTWQAIGDVVGMRRADALDKYGTRAPAGRPVRKRPARLSPERRAELTRRVRGGERAADLAGEFGVSTSYASWLRTHDTVS